MSKKLEQAGLIRISPSDVVFFSLSQTEQDNMREQSPTVNMGRTIHGVALAEVVRARARVFPGQEAREALLNVQPDQLVITENILDCALSDQIQLNTRADLVVDRYLCGELKPSPKIRHFFQLMMTCYALSKNNGGGLVEGLMFFWSSINTAPMVLPEGGRELWPLGVTACTLAAKVIEGQKQLNIVRAHERYKAETWQQETSVTEELSWKADKVDPKELVAMRSEFTNVFEKIKVGLKKQITVIREQRSSP